MPRSASRVPIGASRLSGTQAATSTPASTNASASAVCQLIGHTIQARSAVTPRRPRRQTGMRLSPLPTSFPTTVAALHRVAEEIVAPARKPDNEIALSATPGGFGTPVFAYHGADQQVR